MLMRAVGVLGAVSVNVLLDMFENGERCEWTNGYNVIMPMP